MFKIGDPMGLWLNMAVFELFECVEPSQMTRVQTFLLEFDESWVILSDQCRNHDFEVLNQSINQQSAPITRRPNIRTSYPIPGSSQPLVFRKHFTQEIVANQSKWKYDAVRRSAKSTRHEISVDTDLNIRDGQLLQTLFYLLIFENLVSIEYSLK